MITTGIYLMNGTGHYISGRNLPTSKRIRRISKRDLMWQKSLLNMDNFYDPLYSLELIFRHYKNFPTVKVTAFEVTHFKVIYLSRELVKLKL